MKSDLPNTKPHLSIKLVSLFFVVAGTLLLIGLIGAAMELAVNDYHIYLTYIFLVSICYLVSFGLYRHKKWALYVAYAVGLYLIINFFININHSATADIIIAGVPILLIIVGMIYLLAKKHHHFIH